MYWDKKSKWIAFLGIVIVVGLLSAVYAVFRLGGWRYTLHRLHTHEAWPAYTQRVSQLELLANDSCEVLLIGDSHIAFGAWQELLPEVRVCNRGVPGEGSERMAKAKYWKGALASPHLTSVIIQVGTNDLLFQHEGIGREYARELTGLLQNNDLQLVVCSLPGINNDVRWTGIQAAQIEAFNSSIQAFKSRYPRLKVLDLASLFGGKQGVLPAHLTDDGVHLRGEAYRLWASELYGYINRNTNRVER